MTPFFVSAVRELDFGKLPAARADARAFERAAGRAPVLFLAGDGRGLRDVLARLLRADCVPYVRCLHVPTGRAFAIECYAESASAFSFTEVELPMRDADWLRSIANLARRAFKVRAKCKS